MKKEKAQIKLKLYKVDRDNRGMIIQQIEWLRNELGDEFDCDYIKSLYKLKKKDLKVVWADLVEKNGYPDLDWLKIYY